jgi:ABC-type uncharacterized transport system permease subunit
MSLIQVNKNPTARELTIFGLMLAGFALLLAMIVWWRFQAPVAAQWIAGIGIGIAVVFFAIPPLRKPIYLGWVYLTFPIGWTITHIVMAITYYLVVTPIGLIMRAVGRDPMQRKLDRAATSYWIAHQPADSVERYLRQF